LSTRGQATVPPPPVLARPPAAGLCDREGWQAKTDDHASASEARPAARPDPRRLRATASPGLGPRSGPWWWTATVAGCLGTPADRSSAWDVGVGRCGPARPSSWVADQGTAQAAGPPGAGQPVNGRHPGRGRPRTGKVAGLARWLPGRGCPEVRVRVGPLPQPAGGGRGRGRGRPCLRGHPGRPARAPTSSAARPVATSCLARGSPPGRRPGAQTDPPPGQAARAATTASGHPDRPGEPGEAAARPNGRSSSAGGAVSQAAESTGAHIVLGLGWTSTSSTLVAGHLAGLARAGSTTIAGRPPGPDGLRRSPRFCRDRAPPLDEITAAAVQRGRGTWFASAPPGSRTPGAGSRHPGPSRSSWPSRQVRGTAGGGGRGPGRRTSA